MQKNLFCKTKSLNLLKPHYLTGTKNQPLNFCQMKPLRLTIFLFCSLALGAHAQDTTRVLQPVTVTGFQPDTAGRTSLNLVQLSLRQISEKAAFNLSDALAHIPGVSQMSTGNSISKPVVRGLYGNRVLVLLSGLRFDNQQWQDEHGLGLSQIGIDRVEVIKGPASLIYGSDAMGGVINIIEQKPATPGTYADAGAQLFSNTLGHLTDAGISHNNGKHWWRMRVGAESHADYSDGAGTRVLNSRNNGYYIKAGFGSLRKGHTHELTYNGSFNNYGFVMEDLNTVFSPDARYSRSMAGPHHIVLLNILSDQEVWRKAKSTLTLNAGVQSNSRREDEGSGQISLNMHLLSALQSLRWEKPVNEHLTFVANQQLSFVNNTNYGGRILIPDASSVEANLSGYVRYKVNKWILEAGAGALNKYIHTIATRSLNTPGERIQPFTRNNITVNGMAGAVYTLSNAVTLKGSVGNGSRAPNLAELSANGVHEGVYRYEVGDPNLRIEHNINTDFTALLNTRQWQVSASVYNNTFFNYVHLVAAGASYFGFPVYNYIQQNATLRGGELAASFAPAYIKWLQLRGSFTATRGVLQGGGNLPFIPAYKAVCSSRFEWKLAGRINKIFAEPELAYTFAQNNPAQFETATGDYCLLNLYTGMVITGKGGAWRLGLTGTNLGNVRYADHLSRLKYFGLFNQGCNFIVSARREMKW